MLHSDVLKSKQVLVLGDINIDLLKSDSPGVAEFANTMQSVSFIPVITKPTRFPAGNSAIAPSLLDHIWVNRFNAFTSGIIVVDSTDHCPVFIKIPIVASISEKIVVIPHS